MTEKRITTLKHRVLNKLITITDIPNLPLPLTKWKTEELNHFDRLLEFAYQQQWNEISWNHAVKELNAK